ncbi:thioredoxin domain-containing protein [Actinomarinicola tropica]|uniref:Thioredoxin domain-containing protein n=1 Tax=Actinomarinicola tropica TaxID=2789776 RepID=A0A5Q2RIH5_9ACTN|nr:hypothetical protein [Actinomarinicola tropica]QGG96668.1 hypothetical protein GH723_17055 [Actinomarinicola tropica]
MTTVALVALTVVVALLAVLVVGLLRSHAAILRQLHEITGGEAHTHDHDHDHDLAPAPPVEVGPGDPHPVNPAPGVAPPREAAGAHDIVGMTPDGSAATVGLAGRDHPTLVAFLTSGCGTCLEFWGAIADPAERTLVGADTRIVIATKGPERESVTDVARLAPPGITTVMSTEAWEAHEVPVAPYFILVDGRGHVAGEGAATTWEQLTGLLGRAVADTTEANARNARRAAGRRAAAVGGWSTREADTDQALLDAGIMPGDPSLYDPMPVAEPPGDDR